MKGDADEPPPFEVPLMTAMHFSPIDVAVSRRTTSNIDIATRSALYWRCRKSGCLKSSVE
jgi:hypothetical protein